MKPLISIGLSLVAASIAFAQSPKKSSSSADEQAIKKLEEEWATALVKKDFAVIDRVTMPDWMVTLPDGSFQTKAQSDADMKSGAIVFSSFKVDEIKVRIIGDMAVAFGLETEKSTYKGTDTSGQYRFTDVFVKQDGKWRCTATHVTKVEKK